MQVSLTIWAAGGAASVFCANACPPWKAAAAIVSGAIRQRKIMMSSPANSDFAATLYQSVSTALYPKFHLAM